MTRYHFHVHDGTRLPDHAGTELPNFEAAKRKAVEVAGQHLLQNPETFWTGEEWSLDCCNATDLILFTLNFVAAMSPATRTTNSEPIRS